MAVHHPPPWLFAVAATYNALPAHRTGGRRGRTARLQSGIGGPPGRSGRRGVARPGGRGLPSAGGVVLSGGLFVPRYQLDPGDSIGDRQIPHRPRSGPIETTGARDPNGVRPAAGGGEVTLEEAKGVLMLFRPGVSDPGDGEFAEALELARTDPQLGAWFEQHCAFQKAMREKFRQLEVPPGLKSHLEESLKRARHQRWHRSAPWLAAAAAVVLLVLAASLLGSRKPDHFADYVSRMVRSALVDYRMDRRTTNQVVLREYFAS